MPGEGESLIYSQSSEKIPKRTTIINGRGGLRLENRNTLRGNYLRIMSITEKKPTTTREKIGLPYNSDKASGFASALAEYADLFRQRDGLVTATGISLSQAEQKVRGKLYFRDKNGAATQIITGLNIEEARNFLETYLTFYQTAYNLPSWQATLKYLENQGVKFPEEFLTQIDSF